MVVELVYLLMNLKKKLLQILIVLINYLNYLFEPNSIENLLVMFFLYQDSIYLLDNSLDYLEMVLIVKLEVV